MSKNGVIESGAGVFAVFLDIDRVGAGRQGGNGDDNSGGGPGNHGSLGSAKPHLLGAFGMPKIAAFTWD